MQIAKTGLREILCAGVLLASAGQVQAASDDMPLGALASPPIGYIEMCERTPAYCVESRNASPSQLQAVSHWAGQTRWSVIFGQRLGISSLVANSRQETFAAPAATTPDSPRSSSAEQRTASTAKIDKTESRPSEAQISAETPLVLIRKPRAWDIAYASAVVRRTKPTTIITPAIPRIETPPETWTPPRFFTDLGIDRLNEINRGVNRAIRPTSDQAAFGEADYWSVPSGPRARGDCEDYVLAKRQALIDAGAPVESLSIAVVETTRREVHAVLIVATADGEVILDNLTPWIVSWRETSYRWLQRQAPGSALTWVQPAIDIRQRL